MSYDQLLNWDRDSAIAIAPRFERLHPNWITTISLVLAVAGLSIIHQGHSWPSAIAGSVLIFTSRWVDWIDGFVARATGKSSNLGGLYDIAVGYLTMTTVMIIIGERYADIALVWLGAGGAVVLRLILMGVGWTLARRQRLETIAWNPQKLLSTRQSPCMRKTKWLLDICRADYAIVLFSLAGGSGLYVWGWFYTAAVFALTIWVLVATWGFLRRVPPLAPKNHHAQDSRETRTC
jgi:phosphatidylglycerophosphate synthase